MKNKLLGLLFVLSSAFSYAQVTQKQVDAFKGTATGTDTYSVTINTVTVGLPYDGQKVWVQFANANTGAATLKLNNIAPKAITLNGSALAGGEITAGIYFEFIYRATSSEWQLQRSAGVVAAPTLASVLTAGRDADVTGTINTSGSSLAIDVNTRKLYDASTLAVWWNARGLMYTDGTTAAIDWGNAYMYDQLGNQSGDWNNRILYEANGSTRSMNWGARNLFNNSDIKVVDWNTQKLFNSPFGSETLDWTTGTLSGSWKSTVAFGIGVPSAFTGSLEFSNATNNNVVIVRAGITSPSAYVLTLPTAVASSGQVLTDAAGNGTLSWATPAIPATPNLASVMTISPNVNGAGLFKTSGGANSIHVNDRKLISSTNDALNWEFRTLTNSGGTDIIDWENGWIRESGGNLVFRINTAVMNDLSESPSGDFDSRTLYRADGTTRSIEWEAKQL